MASPPHLHIENQICMSLYSATNALTRAYRPFLDPLDLTYPQYLVMLVLWQQDDVSVTEICAQTRLDTGTVTPLLKRLETKGLLERSRSGHDERMRVISLTRKGRALQQKAERVPFDMSCIGALTPKQALQLKELAEALYRGLQPNPNP
jgi:DNA-binding MarR family transcriptional regulator